MNRWIATLKKHGNAPEPQRQKCQNSPWSTYGTSGTAKLEQNADFSEPRDDGARRYADWTDEARSDLYEERAAIMEFDGGLTRFAAETMAFCATFGDRASGFGPPGIDFRKPLEGRYKNYACKADAATAPFKLIYDGT